MDFKRNSIADNTIKIIYFKSEINLSGILILVTCEVKYASGKSCN